MTERKKRNGALKYSQPWTKAREKTVTTSQKVVNL